MRRISERQLKWWVFGVLTPVHIVFMWMGLILNWYVVGFVALTPVFALEILKLPILTSCYSIVCGPSEIGWLFCLIFWVGCDYLIALILSKKPWRQLRKR